MTVDGERHVAADRELQRTGTVAAKGIDGHRERLFPQLPLHEGRRKRVLRSGRVELFSCAELQAMRRRIHRNGIGPGNRTALVADQEEELPLQFVEDRLHLRQGQIQVRGESLRLNRLPRPHKLHHSEVPNALMVWRHETQPAPGVVRGLGEMLRPSPVGNPEDFTSPPDQDFFCQGIPFLPWEARRHTELAAPGSTGAGCLTCLTRFDSSWPVRALGPIP